ncbi:Protein of unknown function [Desulfacinum infernum DSM 9756]|uniref:DUF1638 domain-containing protein n=1 Tax=Desulfacinum infernum DSM 9756 TaxID=1121391 RepID=A0A1M4TCF9_9BACT|nr:DUF1638 domain-containing protein [Desulfacinum infernum]SHE42074.1 Protein of unknown function [Desulfacinum infernum DSM 9756]
MKVLIACRVFEDELKACLPWDEKLEVVWVEAGLHADLDLLEKTLSRALSEAAAAGGEVRLLYGVGCHPELARLAARFGVPLSPVKNCIEAFCRERTQELERNRTMIMTPGWVRAWHGIMEAMGWNEVDVRIQLGRYDRILLLDPGVNPLKDEEILAFYDLVQIPIDVQPLDLQPFRETLEEVLT